MLSWTKVCIFCKSCVDMVKKYYSERNKLNNNSYVSFEVIKKVFLNLYTRFNQNEYFQEYFGFGLTYGKLGFNIDAEITRKTKKYNLYPIESMCTFYTKDDLFDIIEFLFDHISKPLEENSHYSNYNHCRIYINFDKEAGQKEFREEINKILSDLEEGYELNEEGFIEQMAKYGLEEILDKEIPEHDPENISNKVKNAVKNFRQRHSNTEDKKQCIIELAAVLEWFRKSKKLHINAKDENALFLVVNEFSIRHHNLQQKSNYPKEIYYAWVFHVMLATCHLNIRLLNQQTI